MVGQKALRQKIDNLYELPRFLIFNGMKGCGKKTLAKEIANKFKFQLIFIGTKVDEVREMIKLANEIDTNILFFIDDGNKMSQAAANTLLKITEEAPNNSYIILAVENKDLLLPTIISRGTVFNFLEYTDDEFREYLGDKANSFEIPFNLIYPNLSYLNILPLEKAQEMLDYCVKIKDSMREVNGANAFKITEKIKLKDEQEGWDLTQFLWCLRSVCIHYYLMNLDNFKEKNYLSDYLEIIGNLQRMLSNNLFNKSYILDKLIIDMKEVYYE